MADDNNPRISVIEQDLARARSKREQAAERVEQIDRQIAELEQQLATEQAKAELPPTEPAEPAEPAEPEPKPES